MAWRTLSAKTIVAHPEQPLIGQASIAICIGECLPILHTDREDILWTLFQFYVIINSSSIATYLYIRARCKNSYTDNGNYYNLTMQKASTNMNCKNFYSNLALFNIVGCIL